MSRRLATGERPTKQILLFQAEHPRERDAPKGRQKICTNFKDTWSHAAERQGGNECDLPETSWKFHRPNFRSYGCMEKTEFKKNIMTNVFIDSYYPRLRSNNSDEYDNSRKSLSSFPDINSILLNSGSLTELDSKTQIPKNIIPSPRESKRCKEELLTDEKTRSSESTTIVESNRSKLTLDSKTYTLNSRCSAVEVTSIKNARKVNLFSERNPIGVTEEELKAKKEELNDSLKMEAVHSATNCYDRLHRRIEILEDLLQQTLGMCLMKESAQQVANCNCIKKAKPSKMPTKSKTKFAMSKNLMQSNFPEVANSPNAGDSDLRKENSETDNELMNIKKRVRTLEMILKQTRARSTSDRTSESSEAKPRAEFNKEKKKQEFTQPCLHTFDVCSCFFGKKQSNNPEKEAISGKKSSKVRKKLFKKCRKICSSLTYTKERKNSQVDTKCNEAHQFLMHHIKECDKTFHIVPEPEQEVKNPKPISRETAPEPSKKPRRRHRKKLPRTISTINLAMMENSARNLASGEGEAVFDSDGEVLLHKTSKEVWAETSSYEGLVHCPCWGPYSHPPCQWKGMRHKSVKELKKIGSFRNPIEVLKQGGRIKIPVLFQEVGNSKSNKLTQKISNVSMRFVIVQQDSKRPLKKLMDKLTRGDSNHRKEQYIFGVSELCCGNEKLSPLWRSEFLKGLHYS